MYKHLIVALFAMATIGLDIRAQAGPDGVGGSSCSWNVNKQRVALTPQPTPSQLRKLTKLPGKHGESPLNTYLKTLPVGKHVGG